MNNYVGTYIEGRYYIQEIIGVGENSVVYKAYDNSEDQIVAVKVFRDGYIVGFLEDEMKKHSPVILSFDHPNIVGIYNISLSSALSYIVMEYVDSITLKEYIQKYGNIPYNDSVFILLQILKAMQYAHEHGIVHGALKANNIVLTADGTVKVTDFVCGCGSVPKSLVGYMAPEIIKYEDIDWLTDIYSIGIVFYEMLTGELPFIAETINKVLTPINERPASPKELFSDIPRALEKICLKAISKKQDNRYQSCLRMIDDLENFVDETANSKKEIKNKAINKSFCSKCFEELTKGKKCENCGYDNDTQVDSIYIEPQTIILNDRYVVGAVLEHESDAVTYSGYDLQLDKIITIRELLPKGIANRLEGNIDVHVRERYRSSFDKLKTSFINLWQTIMKISVFSAVIPAYDVFERNGTVYAISEYIESISLREYLLRGDNGIISWDNAKIMFMSVITTLEALHNNGIVHGRISPDSLVICHDGKMRLKCFYICKATEIEFDKNVGYTAIEQYENDLEMCPATDIYAFSACIYRALVGCNPPDAEQRVINDKLMIPNTIAEKIPTCVIKALGGGMKIYPQDRIQSFKMFREQLLNDERTIIGNSKLNDDKLSKFFKRKIDKQSSAANVYSDKIKYIREKEEIKNMAIDENLYTGINRNKYKIVCPYCFHKFDHASVEFRSAKCFENDEEIAKEIGKTKTEIEMDGDTASLERYRQYELLSKGMDEQYRKFWEPFGGTTEPVSKRRNLNAAKPWELPIINHSMIKKLNTDANGFVVSCVDKITNSISKDRVCPKCHNPLPHDYGKYTVKRIAIIGVTGAGKTVYISQLLENMDECVNKIGMSAFSTTNHERIFIENNPVVKGRPLPDSTSEKTLSQPMFFDITKSDKGVTERRTIVLYDIAGENCQTSTDDNGNVFDGADKMKEFGLFVENANGLILLIDPKQMRFVDSEKVTKAKEVVDTLHSVLPTDENGKSSIPIAVCISKSDQCYDILPPIVSEEVQENGVLFDAKTYNQLQPQLKDIMEHNAKPLCRGLESEFKYSNFFAISAIGCDVDQNGPVSEPTPKRIEEPIFWLFKHFGYVKANDKTIMPFEIEREVTETIRERVFGLIYRNKEVKKTIKVKYEEDL